MTSQDNTVLYQSRGYKFRPFDSKADILKLFFIASLQAQFKGYLPYEASPDLYQ